MSRPAPTAGTGGSPITAAVTAIAPSARALPHAPGWKRARPIFCPSDTSTSCSRYAGKIAVATHRIDENDELKRFGADLIFHPYYDAADRAIELLHTENEEALDDYEIEEQREF